MITVERVPALAESAKKVLDSLGYTNIEVYVVGETLGWPGEAPYDAIMVTAGAPKVPADLLAQLAIGGRMVIPVGSCYGQELCKVVRCRDKARKKKINLTYLDKPMKGKENMYPQVAAPDLNPEDAMIVRERDTIIETAIMSLSQKYREVIVLRHQQGLSYEEISKILGKPLETVKVWIHRARKNLKGLLEGAGLK